MNTMVAFSTVLATSNAAHSAPAASPANTPVSHRAVSGGAGFVLTPECTNALSGNRAHQRSVLRHEADDPTLAALRDEAARAGVWLLIGSLGVLTHDADGRFANRSFLIGPGGEIVARYDKIHMFDVDVGDGQTYRESQAYRPGETAVLAAAPDVPPVAESGLPGYEVSVWYGVLAPANTPGAVVSRLHTEISKIVLLPDIRERWMTLGTEPLHNTPEQYAAYLKADVGKWAKVVREANVKID